MPDPRGAACLLLALAFVVAPALPDKDGAEEERGTAATVQHEVHEAGPSSSFLPVAAAVVVWRLLARDP